MNAQQHQIAAENLLKQIPHDVGVLDDASDIGSFSVLAIVALAHATLATAKHVTPTTGVDD